MIGQAIRQLRKQRGLRLEDIATECGVTAVTISRYERGNRAPSKKMLIKLAKALSATTEELSRLAGEHKEETPSPPTGQVTSEATLTAWTTHVIADGPDDPNLKLLLFVLQNYVDKTSWVVSGTIPQIALSASLPVGMVEDLWEELLGSPFVERVGSGEWVLRLVVPRQEDGE